MSQVVRTPIEQLQAEIEPVATERYYGRVTAVMGLLIECGGLRHSLRVGGRCAIEVLENRRMPCEVVGFRNGRALLMPFGAVEGIGLGCKVFVEGLDPVVYPTSEWLGRIVNAHGEAIDGGRALGRGSRAYPLRNQPPPASQRCRVGSKIDCQRRSKNASAGRSKSASRLMA